MTGAAVRIAAIAGGLLLVFALLLLGAASPDPARHERILGALRALALGDAALQRDVLKARAGLLPNYDPLVRDAALLLDAVDALRRAGETEASGAAGQEFRRHVDAIAAAVAEQEALTEGFKSDNALLQNSLRYIAHGFTALDAAGDGRERQEMAAELGRLADAMLMFMQAAHADTTRQVQARIDRLAQLAVVQPRFGQELRLLIAHGRLILATLPAVDAALARLVAVPTAAEARALQEAYLAEHGSREATTRIFRILLALAAVALLAWLGQVLFRLRANARALRERSRLLERRLDFQGLATTISARIAAIRQGEALGTALAGVLGRLGEARGLDRVWIALAGAGEAPMAPAYRWERPELAAAGAEALDPELLRSPWVAERLAREGRVAVPSVAALPPGRERAMLQRAGIAAWLCVPIQAGGRRIGLLGFDAAGGERRWPEEDIALMHTLGGVFASAIDRERIEAERAALEARLRQSEKMEAIGTFAGGIAHDFNNILGAILGYGELALLGLAAETPARRHVREMLAAGERAAALVGSILLFSRRGEAARRPLLAQPVVDEALRLVRVSLPAGIDLRARLEAPEAMVLGDATQLHQVVMNLCANAVQAMAPGPGRLEVALEAVEIGSERALTAGRLAPGPHLRLTVADTGCGIDAATQARVFDPFFTTKPAGQGTGLGLATVHGVVADHGGAIALRSAPGAGSRFEVFLPRSAAPPAAPAPEEADSEAAPCGGGEAILLVDDDPALVRLGEEMLAALGFEPVGFDSGRRALAAFRAEPGRFDLALSDLVMPEMGGLELAAALRAIRPELPVLLMSGHAAAIGPGELRAAGVRALLRKPLQSRDLAAAILPCLRPAAGAAGEARAEASGSS